MHPLTRRLFDVSHDVRQTVCRSKADQQMDVIFRAANRKWNRAGGADCSAEVCMQSIAPSGVDECAALFGAEDNVAVETEMS